MNEGNQILIEPSGFTRLAGPLTLDTVADVYQQVKAEARDGKNITEVDLTAVSRVDSSGLALLLEWQSTAVRAGRSLNILNAPADLLSLVSLCEASDLLVIKGRNGSESLSEQT